MRQSREEKIVFDFYRRIYKAATPSADFDELFANAPLDDDGRRHIDYNAYEVEEEIMEQIIKDIFKQYRVPVYRRKAFLFEFHLGASPKTKRNI